MDAKRIGALAFLGIIAAGFAWFGWKDWPVVLFVAALCVAAEIAKRLSLHAWTGIIAVGSIILGPVAGKWFAPHNYQGLFEWYVFHVFLVSVWGAIGWGLAGDYMRKKGSPLELEGE